MFKIVRSTTFGTFSFALKEDPSIEKMNELVQIAFNLTEPENSRKVLKSEVADDPLTTQIAAMMRSRQLPSDEGKHLGYSPKTEISVGSYLEPSNGVYLQMLDIPKGPIVPAIKELVKLTGLTITGWREILHGNYTKLKFEPRLALEIIQVFSRHEIFAKIVNPDGENSDQESREKAGG